MTKAWWIGSIAALALAGCGDDDGVVTTDAGPGEDAAMSDGSLDAGPDGGPPAGDDAGTPSCTHESLLVTTSDFVNGGLGVLDLASGSAESDDAADDQDTLADIAGCTPVLLERTAGNLRIQSSDDVFTTVRTIDLDPAGSTANPSDVVWIDGEKAYVIASARNEILVVDLGAGEVTGTIDLSGFVDPDDDDGLVDALAGARVGDRVYVALGMYWFDSSYAIHFEGSLLAVVDVTTDALVDVDSETAGIQAIELASENPWRGLQASEAGDTLWVGSAGDFFALDGMIEAIDLDAMTSTGAVVTEETLDAELSGFAFVAPDRLVVLAGTDVIAFDPAGAFPAAPAPLATGVDGLLLHDGSLFTWSRAGESPGLRRFDAADGTELTPSAGPWTFGDLPIYTVTPAP